MTNVEKEGLSDKEERFLKCCELMDKRFKPGALREAAKKVCEQILGE